MTSLFIDRRDADLSYDAGAIIVRENSERVGTIPLAPLTRVFIRGNVNITSNLLGKFGENKVGVVVLSGRKSKPTLLLARPHNDAARRVNQIIKSKDAVFCLDISKQFVSNKIKRQVLWLEDIRDSRPHYQGTIGSVVETLKSNLNLVEQADTLATLRGYEGAAASNYFRGLRKVVPSGLNFKSRNRRPPKDPFNVLLSLSYTLAHAEIAMALFGEGLDPYVGFYHQISFGRESLASDVLEGLRPLVDRFCLKLITKETVRQEHFSTTENACLLGKAGRKYYYPAYEEFGELLRHEIQIEIAQLLNLLEHESSTPF